MDHPFTFALPTHIKVPNTFEHVHILKASCLDHQWFKVKPSFQNNNLERALDWIFTHPEEEESDAVSDMADTEPNDNAFSNTNTHSDPTLSPDRDTTGPRVKDGPGRKCF